jgi:hypothetical protein
MIRFTCSKCGKHLKAPSEYAGRRVICTRCGKSLQAPSPDAPPDANWLEPSEDADLDRTVDIAGRRSWLRGVSVPVLCMWGGGLLVVIAAVFMVLASIKVDPYDQAVRALKTSDPTQSQSALEWLSEADPVDMQRPKVTAALENILLNGDVHRNLDPDLVLRTYLTWADKSNVPALARMVQNPTAPGWDTRKTALAMDALAKLGDERGYAALAEKLADPNLHDQAINALRIAGPSSSGAVAPYAFDRDPNTRDRAVRLLTEFGATPRTIGDAAFARLRAPQADVRRGAIQWFLENGPDSDRQKADGAKLLGKMLADESPDVTDRVMRALKTWATKDCLPDLVEYARRDQLTPGGNADLIEVLARFPDPSAADAIALQLKNPNTRAKSLQALLKLGPVAENSVLASINNPDVATQKEARSVARMLKISDERMLDQTLKDVADSRIARSRTALHRLAEIRPDATNRAKVSLALNATLVDPSRGLSDESLNALRVWGTSANVDTLVGMLGPYDRNSGRNVRVIEFIGALKDPRAAAALAPGLENGRERDAISKALRTIGAPAEDAVVPYLDSLNGAVRCEATRILAEVGTPKSMDALDQAYQGAGGDLDFSRELQVAMQRISARK